MSAFSKEYGPWALVTGAAMGLGAEFARQLAQNGLNLALLDIQEEALASTSRALASKCNVEIRPIILDLGIPDLLPQLISSTSDLGIGLLVNNAGISAIGHFLDLPLEKHLAILAVNARAPMILAHHFGGLMRERKRGGMIFVSSMSALTGTSYVSEYSATKAHDLALGEALWQEMRSFNVDVLTTIVGAADTPGWRAEIPDPDTKTWPPVMTAEDTVRETLATLGKAPSIVPGAQNRLATFLTTRLLSRKSAVEAVGKEMEKWTRPGCSGQHL
ncbi:MAG TPA: SDR family NAD(P)-dependent oxidoreductase [Anaerolineales bacterium]|nr:SDR family NAD(P)-dependent oxidoreductase [Anaerolineales bacterium]